MAEHKVALYAPEPRHVNTAAAYERLAEAIGRDRIGEIDETGIVEVRVEAADFEAALQTAWDAMATAGADDHFVFAEHPSIPEHWRRRGADGLPGALP